MREEDCPAVPDPLVELDGSLGTFRSEVRGDVAQTDGHGVLLCFRWRGWRGKRNRLGIATTTIAPWQTSPETVGSASVLPHHGARGQHVTFERCPDLVA